MPNAALVFLGGCVSPYDTFIERQPKPKLEVVKPKSKAALRAEAIRAYKREHPTMSNRAIAKVMECSLDTVNRAMKE